MSRRATTLRWLRALPVVGLLGWVSCVRNDVSLEQLGAGGSGGFGGGGTGGTAAVGAAGSSGASPDAAPGSGGAAPIVGGPLTRASLLESFAVCALHAYRRARDRAAALEQSLGSPDANPFGGAEREAWIATMAVWEEAEVMQFGPAAVRAVPGGQDFRDEIYSWPLTNRCFIDEQIVGQAYTQPDFASSLANGRGLDAIEYLLFYDGGDNGCPGSSTIDRSGSWAALGADELAARKLAYARMAAADVRARAEGLVAAWEPSGGGFLATFTTAGAGSAVYATDQAALNAVSDALFYIEKEVKDTKLARPLGVKDCLAPTCPEQLESRWAGRSKQHIQANLVGFKKLFVGCGPDFSGHGFEDLLIATGADGLAGQMHGDLDAVIAAGEAIEEDDLAVALATDYASVRAWWTALQRLVDALRTDFLTVLDLELPKRVEGDND